ncbi:MAG TPA: TetR/AcrR family transcriptional regulator [Acidimicrobiales bacterium]|nr:TetR/AcrR family transcriptional regulator [Acidimicrobiales bacterium]
MGLREEKKERLRSQLYEAAIELYRTRGFDQTRVQDVIAAVGVSEPTFFNYFRTKEAVLEEFAARIVDAFIELLRQVVDDEERSLEAKLRLLVRTIADGFASDPEFMAVVVTRSSLFWGAGGGVRDRELTMYALLTELFRRAQGRGEVRSELDPQRLAETFTGAYMLATANWLVGWWDEPGGLADRLDEQAAVILEGCLADR